MKPMIIFTAGLFLLSACTKPAEPVSTPEIPDPVIQEKTDEIIMDREVSLETDRYLITVKIPEEYTVDAQNDSLHILNGELNVMTIGKEEHFGVCGTGLEMKDETLNGYPAATGYYDNSPYWQFAVFKEPYNSLYILYESNEEHLPEFEKILSTLSIVDNS